MPDYKYQGTSRSGSSVSGVMTAANKTELAGILKRQQITATKMTEKGKEFNIPTFGGGGRDGRYSRHHSSAAFSIHRKERQTAACCEVGLGLPGRRLERRGRRHHTASLESRSHFRNPVRRPWRGPSASHANRHHTQPLHWKYIRVPDFLRLCRNHRRAENLVRHASRPLGYGYHRSEAAGYGHADEEDRRRPLYSNPGNADLQRRAHSGRFGHHRQNRGQRRRREGLDESQKVPRRRQVSH